KNSDEFASNGNGYIRKFINAEEYLQKKYFDKEKTEKIEFNSYTLQLSKKGTLVISDYPQLENIIALGQNKTNNITQVAITNCPQLKEINITNFVDNKQLKINNCPNLENLYCGNNKLSEIKGLNECLKLTELKCQGNQLTNLEVSSFANLKILECNTNQLTKLDLSKLKKLEYLSCSNNQLTELNFSENKKLEYLMCDNNQLTSLDLTNCQKLKKFHCINNQLTSLFLPNNNDSNLTNLNCSNNQLTNLDFLAINAKKLTNLNVSDNNFFPSDLSVFAPFTNLQSLQIGNHDKIGQDIYNRFFGSLEPLKNFTKLEYLNVSNTDINSGWEHLPNSIGQIYYSSEKRSNSKVKEITEQLK